jgi:hypothetical protein
MSETFKKWTGRFEEDLLKDMNLEASKRQQSTADFVRDAVRDKLKSSQGQAVLVENVPDALRTFAGALKDLKLPAIDLSKVISGTAKQSAWSMPEPDKVEIIRMVEDKTDSDKDGYVTNPAWQKCGGWSDEELRLLTKTLRDPTLSDAKRRVKRLMNALTLEELTGMRRPDLKELEAVCSEGDRVVVRSPDSWRIVWVVEPSKKEQEPPKVSGTYRSGFDPDPADWKKTLSGDDAGGDEDDDDTDQDEGPEYEEGSIDDIALKERAERGEKIRAAIDLLRELSPIDHFPADIAKEAWIDFLSWWWNYLMEGHRVEVPYDLRVMVTVQGVMVEHFRGPHSGSDPLVMKTEFMNRVKTHFEQIWRDRARAAVEKEKEGRQRLRPRSFLPAGSSYYVGNPSSGYAATYGQGNRPVIDCQY